MIFSAINKKYFSVYLWKQGLVRFVRKPQGLRQSFSLPKGIPTRIEAFDNLDITTLRIGPKHSAAISKDGILYMFGAG